MSCRWYLSAVLKHERIIIYELSSAEDFTSSAAAGIRVGKKLIIKKRF